MDNIKNITYSFLPNTIILKGEALLQDGTTIEAYCDVVKDIFGQETYEETLAYCKDSIKLALIEQARIRS